MAVHDSHGHGAPDARHDHDHHAEHGSHHGGEVHSGPAGAHGSHDKHAGHSVAIFRDRFWGALGLSIPTLIWSPSLQEWLSYSAPGVPGASWIPAVFGTAVFWYGGRVFLTGAVGELRDRAPGMMTLISMAITVAFGYSAAVALGWEGEPLWWELATLVTIMILGHWIEMRSIGQARGALKELAALLPDMAVRVTDDGLEEVPMNDVQVGDVLLVRPGASVPADGEVVEGRSEVDEAMLTGESAPVSKEPGSEVVAGTMNVAGSLRIRVTGQGDGTVLAGIMRLVSDAQESRSRAQALADRAARWLTFVALAAGTLTLTAWLVVGDDVAFAVQRLVAVLVIACPHALGLAVPLVVAISTTVGVRNGVLVRDRRGLEEARSLDAVVFDKTGTLTSGDFGLVSVDTVSELSEDEALRLIASVERDSEHTIARGLLSGAEERGLSLEAASEFAAMPGKGVEAVVEGRRFQVGGPRLLEASNVELPEAIAEAGDRSEGRGQTTVYLIEGGRAIAVFGLADRIRPESREAVESLRGLGVEVIMLTGDARRVAEAVAEDLGIDRVYAEVLPEQKAEIIRELQSDGKRVAMVGDGVNDAPALLSADVGLAIGAGTDVAVEAGDVVLVRNDPRDIPRVITLSRATYRKMTQNLWWAAGYNVVALPLAAGVGASWGVLLPPAAAAVLMSMSTVVVAVNAQLLRRVEL